MHAQFKELGMIIGIKRMKKENLEQLKNSILNYFLTIVSFKKKNI